MTEQKGGVAVETDLQTIVDFLKEIAGQDNRGTAAPYFYVIMDRKKVVVGRDHDESESYWSGEDYDELVYLNEDYEEISAKDYDKLPEKSRTRAGIKWHEVEHSIFLTESDAKAHLKANHYHYSSWAHTYVKHCWRAPQIESFFKALYRHFEVNKGKLDLRIELSPPTTKEQACT